MTAGIVGFAATQQRRHDVGSTPEQRKAIGHFGTPPAIAEFMAGMVADLPEKDIAILDPGAGVGTLTAALCDRIARLKKPRSLSIELWESDVASSVFRIFNYRLLNLLQRSSKRVLPFDASVCGSS